MKEAVVNLHRAPFCSHPPLFSFCSRYIAIAAWAERSALHLIWAFGQICIYQTRLRKKSRVFPGSPLMGCFAVQKAKKKLGEQSVRPDEVGDVELEDSSLPTTSSSPSSPKKPASLASPKSFRRTVRAIQNAQRFINHSNSKLSSVHTGRDIRSSEQGTALSDVGTLSKPMPLPSPRLSPKPTGYALPHPTDHGSAIATSPNPLPKTTSASHAALNSRVFPWDLQPLPPPKDSFMASKGLKSFTFEELGTACQDFSHQALIGDDGASFNGVISTSLKGAKQQLQQQQEIVVLRLHEKLHLGLKEWLSELYSASHPLDSHVCNLMGFYNEDGIQERYLVYEKLQRGNLHRLLFDASDTPSLDWSMRLKVIHGAVQGLASLQERFPEQVLYRDFRSSHVQVDSDNSAKISGYWFVTSSSQILQAHGLGNSSSGRDNAYCAPETRSRGLLTWNSTVWSFGVVMLELLCGRKNNDDRIAKDEKNNLVKWAKPFLLEEDKLFLIMDPKLQGRFPSKGAKIMANLIMQCLKKDPTRRPSMKMVAEMVKAAKEPRHTNKSAWKERSSNEVTDKIRPYPKPCTKADCHTVET
ncbi:hypothetical protein GOP47_0020765 [Adiantum capillus-veneris]|uniref:Protein kinase domain-containing protein n=1 Tax=Adiantum capillus-veneris TaxID=13818 RepID=A0A9D4UAB6_ADICA|nr:hypothetical protein GOP47_0020765 [Adiantum capillus-veneris]